MEGETDTFELPARYANAFAPDEFAEIVQNFKDVDADGSGSIGANELATVFTRLGFEPEPSDVAELLVEVDTDGSGEVEFGEFVDMMFKFKTGGMGNAKFDKMLSMLNSNPINMLEEKATSQRLTATYRVVEERPADASVEACIVMEVTIAGLFKEIVNRKVVAVEKSETYQGIAATTRRAKCNAASAALRKLKASLPGLHCEPGEIPKQWLEWYRRNIERGVKPTALLDALVTKGFTPSLNVELMQWTHARQSLLRVEAGRPGLTAVTAKGMPVPVPVEWAKWIDDNRKMGVSGKALAAILDDHERKRAKGFAASSAAAAVVASYAHAAEEDAARSDSGQSVATRSSGGSSLVAAEKRARHMHWGSQYDPSHRQQLQQHLERWQPEARQHLDEEQFEAAPGQYTSISTNIEQKLGPRGVRQDRTKLAIGTDAARLKHWSFDGGFGPGTGPTLMRWFEAVIRNDIAHVRRYIAAGQDLNVTECFAGRRRSGLSLAAEGGHPEMALMILDGGASANGGRGESEPPLHIACRMGDLAVVQELVSKGASVHSFDNSRNTPMHKAAGGGHRHVVHWLAKHQEERQRWLFVSIEFNKLVMHTMAPMTSERVPRHKHQNFDKKWFSEAAELIYRHDHGEYNGVLPLPQKAVTTAVVKRMDPNPEKPVFDTQESRDKRAFIRLMKSVLSETFLNGGNRAGQTPLHMAVDPPSVGAVSSELLPRFVDTVRCLVEEHYVISTVTDGCGRTAMDCLAKRSEKLRKPMTKFLGARKVELEELEEQESALALMHADRAESVAASRFDSPARLLAQRSGESESETESESESDLSMSPRSPPSGIDGVSVISATESLSPGSITPRGHGLAAVRAMRPGYSPSARPRPPPPRVRTPQVWPGTLVKSMWRYEWNTEPLLAEHKELVNNASRSNERAIAALIADHKHAMKDLAEKQTKEIAWVIKEEKAEVAALADAHADQIFEAEAKAEILRNKAKRAEKKARKEREEEDARREEAGEPSLAEEAAANTAASEGGVFSGLESPHDGSATGMAGASALDLFAADEASDLGPMKERHYQEMAVLLKKHADCVDVRAACHCEQAHVVESQTESALLRQRERLEDMQERVVTLFHELQRDFVIGKLMVGARRTRRAKMRATMSRHARKRATAAGAGVDQENLALSRLSDTQLIGRLICNVEAPQVDGLLDRAFMVRMMGRGWREYRCAPGWVQKRQRFEQPFRRPLPSQLRERGTPWELPSKLVRFYWNPRLGHMSWGQPSSVKLALAAVDISAVERVMDRLGDATILEPLEEATEAELAALRAEELRLHSAGTTPGMNLGKLFDSDSGVGGGGGGGAADAGASDEGEDEALPMFEHLELEFDSPRFTSVQEQAHRGRFATPAAPKQRVMTPLYGEDELPSPSMTPVASIGFDALPSLDIGDPATRDGEERDDAFEDLNFDDLLDNVDAEQDAEDERDEANSSAFDAMRAAVDAASSSALVAERAVAAVLAHVSGKTAVTAAAAAVVSANAAIEHVLGLMEIYSDPSMHRDMLDDSEVAARVARRCMVVAFDLAKMARASVHNAIDSQKTFLLPQKGTDEEIMLQRLRSASLRLAADYVLCEWGCNEWLPRGPELQDHLRDTCMMRILPCPFVCGAHKRADEWITELRPHRRVCRSRPVACPRCEMKMRFFEVEDHMVNLCPQRPIPPLKCRLGCGFVFTGRSDKQLDSEANRFDHEKNRCPLRIVRCGWPDCGLTIKGSERAAHRWEHIQRFGVRTFAVSGEHAFVVPPFVRRVKLQLWGGGGGGGCFGRRRGAPGGGGGYIEAILTVTPGMSLTVVVGGGGVKGCFATRHITFDDEGTEQESFTGGEAPGGWPGGGVGCSANDVFAAGGGGGYSAVLRDTAVGKETLAIAGGGGGGGSRPGHGGGGVDEEDMDPRDGHTATYDAAGEGGAGGGSDGFEFQGGRGASFGAGGGGGRWGGGGGGFSPGLAVGGGGGSSFAIQHDAELRWMGEVGSEVDEKERALVCVHTLPGGAVSTSMPGGLPKPPERAIKLKEGELEPTLDPIKTTIGEIIVPPAQGVGEWDVVGGLAGQGGHGAYVKATNTNVVENGRSGAIRISLPGFYHDPDRNAAAAAAAYVRRLKVRGGGVTTMGGFEGAVDEIADAAALLEIEAKLAAEAESSIAESGAAQEGAGEEGAEGDREENSESLVEQV